MEGRTVSVSRIPATWLVLGGVTSVQFGAAIAKSLFDDLTPTGLVALRLLFGGLLLGLLFRPSVRHRPWPSFGSRSPSASRSSR